MIIEFIFGNKAKRFLANMNSIQVTTQDLFRLHSGCHGDFIDVATKSLLVHIVPRKLHGKYELNTA